MKRDREDFEKALEKNGDFKDLGLGEKVVNALAKTEKYVHPTDCQKQAIPVFLQGHDVLVRSETGSGKTLVYLLPILHMLQSLPNKMSRADGSLAIIIAPTRELVVQIVEEAQALARQGMHWVVPGYLIGGEKKKSEKARLRKGITILAGTPGRLLDHLKTTESFNVRNLKFLVFDEADRLLDMGFENDIRAIINELKEKRRTEVIPQTALISATLWDKVMTLASLALNNPVTIDVKSRKVDDDAANKKKRGADEGHDGEEGDNNKEEEEDHIYKGAYDPNQQFSTPATLKQHYIVVPCKQRLVILANFIQWQMKKMARVIIFFSSCAEVDFVYAVFSAKMSNKFFKLHGQMAQIDRVKSFTAFRGKKADNGAVLLCTDAAARGLDFPQVRWIVQYDTPPEPKEYIHRVGRTARIGHEGRALLFLMPHEVEYVSLMQNHGVNMHEVPLDRIPEQQEPISNADFEQFVAGKKELFRMATTAFGSFVKSYAAHAKGTKHIFHPKALHFGHVAKSFALSVPPGAFRKIEEKESKFTRPKSGKTLSNPYKRAVSNEFSSGI